MINEKREYDVIVVGGGGSGLAAALSTVQNGSDCLLVEHRSSLGGTTALSTGLISAARTRNQFLSGILTDSSSKHFSELMECKSPISDFSNIALRRLLTREVSETIRWLESIGIKFLGPFSTPEFTVPRTLFALPNSKAYIYFLEKEYVKLGGRIMLSKKFEDFIYNDGKISGVKIEGIEYLSRKGVILATGDFSGNHFLREKYIPHYNKVDAINPDSLGTGFEVSIKYGAKIINGNTIRSEQVRFSSIRKHRKSIINSIPPWSLITYIMSIFFKFSPDFITRKLIVKFLANYLSPSKNIINSGAVLVDSRGDYFDMKEDDLSITINNQCGKVGYFVFDADIYKFLTENHISNIVGLSTFYIKDFIKYRHDLFYKADSIELLSKALGVNNENLQKSMVIMSKINNRILSPPFFALGPVESKLSTTMGGLAIDEDFRVLKEDGKPIDGLFAVGSVGYGGLAVAGLGHNLAWAFTSGRLVGNIVSK